MLVCDELLAGTTFDVQPMQTPLWAPPVLKPREKYLQYCVWYTLWTHRNSYYYKNLQTGEMTLREALCTAIRSELISDTHQLPSHYAPYFWMPSHCLLGLSVIGQNNWHCLITLAKESLVCNHPTIFTPNGISRQWVGLPLAHPLCHDSLCFADDKILFFTT